MIRGMCLSAAALVMFAAPAFAADSACKEPTSPTMPDGKTAPAAQIVAAANAVKAFVTDSDAYQQCLKDEIDKMEVAAKAEKKAVDPKVKADYEAMGDANQTKKEMLGAAYAATAAAYRSAHPR